jgi:hypothetical protein
MLNTAYANGLLEWGNDPIWDFFSVPIARKCLLVSFLTRMQLEPIGSFLAVQIGLASNVKPASMAESLM